MKKLAVSILAFAPFVMAQTNTPVVISPANPPTMFEQVLFYDGSGNLQYICKAPKQSSQYTWGITLANGTRQNTLTNIVVSTNTATATTGNNHGLQIGNLITVAASTTAALNGNYVVLTTPSATTFTFTTVGVADATYSNAAMTLSTWASLTSQPWWSITKLTTTTGNLSLVQTSTHVTAGGGATPSYDFICDNKAVTTGATAIAYQ